MQRTVASWLANHTLQQLQICLLSIRVRTANLETIMKSSTEQHDQKLEWKKKETGEEAQQRCKQMLVLDPAQTMCGVLQR